MSHIHDGPLATYNSLCDGHLSGYFANSRMRRHLRKSGLITKSGQIVTESTYRLNMSRKEHKKHVKDMLAQAIVHKTLDLERARQAEIKRKLEEIAKIQLVRRVRATSGRRGDEDVLPLLTPRSSRPGSSPTYQSKGRRRGNKPRPYSAPRAGRESRLSQMSVEEEGDVLYLDDEGRPITPDQNEPGTAEQNQVDTRHLHTLDTAALRKYAILMAKMEEGRGVTSPYMLPQVPLPPRAPMSARTPRSVHSARRVQSASPQRQVVTDSRIARLHRPETAKAHAGDQQTMCKVLMKYHGWALKLAREKMDPTQEVVIEQQHCGGNTLTVFKERLLPGAEFEFVSYRHRGYPFSLSLYVDGQMDSRVSTCCEYRHKRGAKIGGPQGHFSLIGVQGAVPCYKCQVAKGVVMRHPAKAKKSKRAAKQHKEEVIVVSTEKSDRDGEYLEERIEYPKPSDEKEEDAVVVAVEKEENEEDDTKQKSAKSADASYDDDFEESDKSSASSSSSSESESDTESSTRKDEDEDNNKPVSKKRGEEKQERQEKSKEKFSPIEPRGEERKAESPRATVDQRASRSPSPRVKSPQRVEVNGTSRSIDDYSSDEGEEEKDKVVSMENVEAETRPIGRRGSVSSASSSSSSASPTPRATDDDNDYRETRQEPSNAVVSMDILDREEKKEEERRKEKERNEETRRREEEERLRKLRDEREKRREEDRKREEQRRQEMQFREQQRQEDARKREEQRRMEAERERQRREEEEENRRREAMVDADPELRDAERQKAQKLREAQILEEQIAREAKRKEEERAREQRFRESEEEREVQRKRDAEDKERRHRELEESLTSSRTGSSTARSTSVSGTSDSASSSAQTTPRRVPDDRKEVEKQITQEPSTPNRLSTNEPPPRPTSPFPDFPPVYVDRPKRRHDPVPPPAEYQPRYRAPRVEEKKEEQEGEGKAVKVAEKSAEDTYRSTTSEMSSSQYTTGTESESEKEGEGETPRPKTAAGGRYREGQGW